uniref:Uncharacterized protein n=1 Tax=Arundo donax TaxID=35708 RepID=A0A0A9F6S0_ARUDO
MNSFSSPAAANSSRLGRTSTATPPGSSTLASYAAAPAPTFLTLLVTVCAAPVADRCGTATDG